MQELVQSTVIPEDLSLFYLHIHAIQSHVAHTAPSSDEMTLYVAKLIHSKQLMETCQICM